MNNKRHQIILEIIREKEISTQEELQNELRDRGFDVTQATVSRDIRKLRLVKKQATDGKNIYVEPADPESIKRERFLRVMRHAVRKVDFAQNILVLKTDAGMAMGTAAAVDGLDFDEVVGCIAGDDTIMVAMRTREDAENACFKLKRDLDMI